MDFPKLNYQFDQLTSLTDPQLRRVLQEMWQEIATKFNQLSPDIQQQIINAIPVAGAATQLQVNGKAVPQIWNLEDTASVLWTFLGRNIHAAASGGGSTYPPLPEDVAYINEDFWGGTDPGDAAGTAQDFEKQGSIGEIGFEFLDGASHVAIGHFADYLDDFGNPFDTSEHPGVFSVYVATNAGNAAQTVGITNCGGTYSGHQAAFDARKAFVQRFWFRMGDITMERFTIGSSYKSAAIVPETNTQNFVLAFEPLIDPTNFHFQWGTNTDLDTGVAADTNWHLLTITHTALGVILTIGLDGVTVGTVGFTPVPTEGNWPIVGPAFGMRIASLDATPHLIHIDRYDCLISGLVRH